MKTFLQIKLINDKIGLKSYEMLRFAQQTEEIEKQALIIANKLNESNTRSFLAKKKMIQVKRFFFSKLYFFWFKFRFKIIFFFIELFLYHEFIKKK